MLWQSRFVAVPTDRLRQDEQVLPSDKASPDQIRAYMRRVPSVYAELGAGAQGEDFQRLRTSTDANRREVAEAFRHLFSQDGYSHRLEAEIVDGTVLVVTRGRHRFEAARELGVPYVPVHVRAPDIRSLDAAARSFENEVGRSAPDVVRAHRKLEAEHGVAHPERYRSSPIASTPSREHARRYPSAPAPSTPSTPSRDRTRR